MNAEMTNQKKLPKLRGLNNHHWWQTINEFAREKPVGFVAALIFGTMLLLAFIGPLITPYDPLTTDVLNKLQPPSWAHLFGTAHIGRDILSRLIAGARTAMLISVSASFIGASCGYIIGVVSGYLGGKIDLAIQRVMEVLMTFPMLILAIAIAAVLGGSILNLIVALTIPMLPGGNRVARSISLRIKQNTFIEAAQAVGVSQRRIIFNHVLPNTMAMFLITLTGALGGMVLAEASLSFLGLGIAAPAPAWGRELNESMRYFYSAPHVAIFPGIVISLAVFGASMFGDALRDKLDPKLRRL